MRAHCGAILLVVLCASGASSTTYLLEPDGSGDFLTIQAAIDASVNGDIIELADGLFAGGGNRDLDTHGKAITIRSANGDPELCTIDCGGTPADPHRGFEFHSNEGPDTVIEGITVTNGYSGSGGAVRCNGSSGGITFAKPTLSDCRFVNNHVGGLGGALYCTREGAAPTVVECVFEDNSAANMGGAAYIDAHASNLIVFDSCRFERNTARLGGGVYLFRGTYAITSCEFRDNIADEDGGGMWGHTSIYASLVSNSLFSGNEAGGKGGGYCSPSERAGLIR